RWIKPILRPANSREATEVTADGCEAISRQIPRSIGPPVWRWGAAAFLWAGRSAALPGSVAAVAFLLLVDVASASRGCCYVDLSKEQPEPGSKPSCAMRAEVHCSLQGRS